MGVSRWNAFVHAEAKHINQENPDHCMKAHELSAYLEEKWNSMTDEEKIALTDPLLEELKEHRNSMSHGEQNVTLELFLDARQSLLMIQNYVSTCLSS
ncbi:hypothetical protein C0993_008835 [Termitomyces sp. T159_Od127]|nr:hypothetical protein C0993_008835 [Termitomyces sp. T159_Od127]